MSEKKSAREQAKLLNICKITYCTRYNGMYVYIVDELEDDTRADECEDAILDELDDVRHGDMFDDDLIIGHIRRIVGLPHVKVYIDHLSY